MWLEYLLSREGLLRRGFAHSVVLLILYASLLNDIKNNLEVNSGDGSIHLAIKAYVG